MTNDLFSIEVTSIFWIVEDDENGGHDRCAHGSLEVLMDKDVIIESSDDGFNLSACGLHLLRTTCENHTYESRVGQILLPYEGHHIDFLPNTRVAIETGGAFDSGVDWWVEHENNCVKLTTETKSIIIPLPEYQREVLKLVNAVEEHFANSVDRILPEDDYDRTAYSKFWEEWHKLKAEVSQK